MAGSTRLTLVWDPRVHRTLTASAHLEERLEFSYGLITALGEPRTLLLGLLASDPDLNPPQPVRPEPNTTALMAK